MTGARQDLADTYSTPEGARPAEPQPKLSPELRFLEMVQAEEEAEKPSPPAAQEEEEKPDQEAEEQPDTEEPTEESDEEDSDDTDAAAETTEQDDDPTYNVRIDGEPTAVRLSELVRGYSRHGDYTRKTQKLAEERKAFEQDAVAVRNERTRYDQLLGQLQQAVEHAAPAEPSAELRQSNPAEYAAQMADYQRRRDELQSLQQEQGRVQEQQALDYQKQVADRLKVEEELLLERLTDWRDTEKADTGKKELTKYLINTAGFAPEELAQIVDHRAIVIAHKAMLYDKLQQAKPGVVKKARRAKTAKPGGARTMKPTAKSDESVRRAALAQSGSQKDAAAVFLDMIKAEEQEAPR